MVNEQVIESLGYRVGTLADSLYTPAEGDANEEARRRDLTR